MSLDTVLGISMGNQLLCALKVDLREGVKKKNDFFSSLLLLRGGGRRRCEKLIGFFINQVFVGVF